MSKYTPLQKYLEQRKSTDQEIYLSFKKIEEIMVDKLPNSAYEYRQWWENEYSKGSHVQSKAWIGAGFKVDMSDLEGEVVRFVLEIPK